MSKRFVVEGAWLKGNDGAPVTRDFVVAETADDATALVKGVRQRLEPWQTDTTLEFDDFIATERAILDRMARMSLEDVETSWAETRASLIDDEDEGCDECMTYPCSCDVGPELP